MKTSQQQQQERNREMMRKRAFDRAIELRFKPSDALAYAERYATGEIVDIWDFDSVKRVYMV